MVLSEEKIPVISIQCDWEESLKVAQSEIWVSWKIKDEPSKQGFIHNLSSVSESISLGSSECFVVETINDECLKVSLNGTPFSTLFLAPIQIYNSIHNKSIVSLSVTTEGIAVSACSGNVLKVWNINEAFVKLELQGHVGELYKCRFFPSEQVILTCGADMRIKIWSADTGVCPVTLVGHTMAVTDVAVVDRGRNIVSVSKDGTAKLWHCGDSECLGDVVKVGASINCCQINDAPISIKDEEPDSPSSPKEINTANKILLLGCEDGSVHCVGLKSRKIKFTIRHEAAVNSIACIDRESFLVGCQDGKVILYTFKLQPKPVKVWFESNSAVLKLLQYKQKGFFAARADGSVVFRPKDNNKITLTLTGPNFDPVYDLATDGRCVYTCCRDAVVRRYNVEYLVDSFF